MSEPVAYIAGLDAFAEQFRAQIDNAGPPASEHGVHFCLALGFQAAYDLPIGSIVFERPVSVGRLDLWITPFDLLIEVKYRRPIPSGRNLPQTQIFGSLLADFNKVTHVAGKHRLVILVSDEAGVRYIQRSGRSILPMSVGERTEIGSAEIARLPQTASTNAEADAPWAPLSTNLVWSATRQSWQMLAWSVDTIP